MHLESSSHGGGLGGGGGGLSGGGDGDGGEDGEGGSWVHAPGVEPSYWHAALASHALL